MDAHIIDALRKEAADLSLKLSAIRNTLTIYGVDVAQGDIPPAAPSPLRKIVSRSYPSVATGMARQAVSYAERVRDVARLTIERSDVLPVPTRDIIEEVKRAGIEIRGQSELNAVSALLSRSSDFVSNGRTGWTLANVSEIPKPSASIENGAPEGAPDTGGVAAPSSDNRTGEAYFD